MSQVVFQPLTNADTITKISADFVKVAIGKMRCAEYVQSFLSMPVF